MCRFTILAIVLALLASRSTDAASPCSELQFGGPKYVVCTVDLRIHSVRLFWKDTSGQPYGGFDHLPRRIEGGPILFAMNGGMYESDRSPVGLYVEQGKTFKQANKANGVGNFYLKPNGILYIQGQKAGIATTERFLSAQPRADFATQSGPMLVIDGRTHPRIKPGSASRKIRNGVGLRDPHTLVFAISEAPVTFWEFAQLFRVGLSTRNALFLDGGISSLYSPALRRFDRIYPMGPIIAVYVLK